MPMLNQVLRVEILDEDLLPGQKSDDDDLIGRVDVMLEGVLRMDSPIREWFTLGDLSVPPSGPDGSQAQVELDISFYGAQERRLEKEAKLRKRRTTSGTVFPRHTSTFKQPLAPQNKGCEFIATWRSLFCFMTFCTLGGQVLKKDQGKVKNCR